MLLTTEDPVDEGTTITREASDGERVRGAEHQPTSYLHVLLDTQHLRDGASRFGLDRVSTVHVGRGDRGESGQSPSGSELFVKLPDPLTSRQHARLHLRDGEWTIEDLGGKNGTLVDGRYVGGSILLKPGALIEVGQTFLRLRRSSVPTIADAVGVRADSQERGLVTLLPELVESFERLAAFARTDGQVAILGETGSGKDYVAQAYHSLTSRSGAFVAVNCATLTDGLVEAALFGHRKGAYSGATSDNPGYVRSAEGGTLFLDEIGDLRLSAQAALLRVLDAREVMPVGASKAVPVDIRVVSATHRDIPAMVERGEFRRDLWARLAGFVQHLPPLRDRIEDISVFLSTAVLQHQPERADRIRLAIPAARSLLMRRWPANIRELSSAMRQALSFAKSETLTLEDLPKPAGPEYAATAAIALDPTRPARTIMRQVLEEELVEGDKLLRERLERLLEEHGGNVSEVARVEGRHRAAVHEWLKKLGIDPSRYRSKIRRP